MKITESYIKGLYILEPRVFEDSRGYFFESYNKKLLEEKGSHSHLSRITNRNPSWELFVVYIIRKIRIHRLNWSGFLQELFSM